MRNADEQPCPFEAALQQWLERDIGVEEPRRLAGVGEDEVRLSKHEPAFVRRLFELLDLVPELFDERAVIEAYEREAATAPADASRVATWAAAAHALLRDAGARHNAPDAVLAEVRTGIESVRAILESVLWSKPAVGDAYSPRAGEIASYREMLATLRDDEVFVRYYGTFQGRAVRDYCPAAAHAHVLLAHAWRACTGTPPPA